MEILKKLINANNFDEIDEAIREAKKLLDVFNKLPTPLFELLIVKRFEPENKVGNLILPSNENVFYGTIIKKGDKVNENINIGDTMIWFSETGEEMNFMDEAFLVMNLPEKVLIISNK